MESKTKTPNRNRLDFSIGYKFQNWTVISERSYHKTKCTTPFYIVECKCGFRRKATPNQISQILRFGFHQDLKAECLNCIKQTRLKEKPVEILLNSVLSDYKTRYKKNNLEYTLYDEFAMKLFQQPCSYCGLEPSNIKKTHAGIVKYSGIDRVDSSKGYIPENVVSCCKRCNVGKNNQTLAEFTEWYTRLYKYNLQRPEQECS